MKRKETYAVRINILYVRYRCVCIMAVSLVIVTLLAEGKREVRDE